MLGSILLLLITAFWITFNVTVYNLMSRNRTFSNVFILSFIAINVNILMFWLVSYVTKEIL